MRQEFCREWGGDIYTLLQSLFKKQTQERKSISFNELFEIGRENGLIFNDVEFRALWRRSKKGRENLSEKIG